MPGKDKDAERRPRTGAAAGPLDEWNTDLVEALFKVLYGPELEAGGLDGRVRELEERYGDEVYAELIHLLSHLRFPAVEAKECWRQILAHQSLMARGVGAPVDLRVALVSYFVEVNRQLRNPKVIELKLFEQTQASAYRDELTSLCNYRAFREHLVREIQRSERYNSPLSLVMVDLDDFKSYNDRLGHEAGNRALVSVARLLSESLRRIDVPARYGGEEFALILPSTTKTGAQLVADRTREKIADFDFADADGMKGARLTVSMGVATCPADAREAPELVRRADSAMYGAKAGGKNQVHLYGQNRRSRQRVEIALDGRYRVFSKQKYLLVTVNLSEGGMLALFDRKLEAGSLVQLFLGLPGADSEIETTGTVLRVGEGRKGRFVTAIKFLEIENRDHVALGKYLRDLTPREDDTAAAPGNQGGGIPRAKPR